MFHTAYIVIRKTQLFGSKLKKIAMLFPLVYLEIRSLCKVKISEQPGKILLNTEYSKQLHTSGSEELLFSMKKISNLVGKWMHKFIEQRTESFFLRNSKFIVTHTYSRGRTGSASETVVEQLTLGQLTNGHLKLQQQITVCVNSQNVSQTYSQPEVSMGAVEAFP